MILEIFFKDPDPPDPWPKDPGSEGSGLKTHGSPTLVVRERNTIKTFIYYLLAVMNGI